MHKIILLLAFAAHAVAKTTISSTAKFAYGANTGWISFRPGQPSATSGVIVGENFLSGFAYSANFGWINLGSGSPLNGYRYFNGGPLDFGVNHDSAGGLSGWAYGANIGWINFDWAGANDPNRPQFDLFTGTFSGFAYSANTGWIALGGNLVTTQILRADTDGDGIADAWEMAVFENLTTAGVGTDADSDGQSDAAEYLAGTDPLSNASWFRITEQLHGDTSEKVRITFADTSPARHYRIETTTDLRTAWQDSGLGIFAPDAGGITSRLFPVSPTSSRFYRIVAVQPLP